MGGAPGDQYHFDPSSCLELVLAEVPSYRELQRQVALATPETTVGSLLDLGIGTGETSAAVLRRHPDARLVAIDQSGYDKPSGLDEQLEWLAQEGFLASVCWAERDLAVVAADRRGGR